MTASYPHLRAALVAVVFSALLLGAGVGAARHLERRYIHGVAPEIFHIKNQGIALQKEAFSQDDLLPIYGSSELLKNVPDRASLFFRHAPTQFSVFPVGKPGNEPLIILEKLVAMGEVARGRKVVISLSPSWFFSESVNPEHYAANFSLLQANEVVFSHSISAELKRDMARRMLSFEETLRKRPPLERALRSAAGEGWKDRVTLEYLGVEGALGEAIARTQDHLMTALYLWKNPVRAHPGARPASLDWPELLTKAASETRPVAAAHTEPDERLSEALSQGETGFVRVLERAEEWADLELLMRGLRELGMRPLFVTMPINGVYFDEVGVSATSRALYYERLHGLADRYAMPLVDFRSHELDSRFFLDHHDHLSMEGWMYYDELLDEFFHDRALLSSVATARPQGEGARGSRLKSRGPHAL